MGHDELRRIVEKVSKDLTPSCVDVRREGEDVLHVYIVSEQFSGIPISKRLEKVSRLFEEQGPSLAEEFTLVFQAWTKAEAEEIGFRSSSEGFDDTKKPNRRAAKPADL